MIRQTVWHPDTCGCKITLEWDDAEPAETRTHTAAEVDKCPVHTGTVDNDHHLSTVMDENQRKNIVHGHIFDTMPHLKPQQGRAAVFDDAVKWSFDADRTLHVSIPSANAADKAAIQTLANKLKGKTVIT